MGNSNYNKVSRDLYKFITRQTGCIMKTVIIVIVLFVVTACANSSENFIAVTYEEKAFHFELKRMEDTGFTDISGKSIGEGFRQATGELEDIFAHIWGDYRYRMDPKWKGINFNFTLRFSENGVDERLFKKMAAEVSRQSGISIDLKEEKIAARCLKVDNQELLASHRYQMEGGVAEGFELSSGKLRAKGIGLNGLVKHLNGLNDGNSYFFNGTDHERYYIELDVSDQEKLAQSLSSFGITLKDCQVEVEVVEIK